MISITKINNNTNNNKKTNDNILYISNKIYFKVKVYYHHLFLSEFVTFVQELQIKPNHPICLCYTGRTI